MAKFTKKKKKGMDEISTASLPDIVFMLLFFFMLVTVLKSEEPLVNVSTPKASELTNIEQKTLVKYINIGSPINKELYGDVPVLQLNDAIASVDDVQIWVSQKRGELAENEQSKMIVSMKVDREVKMGIVTDVKQELRKANALKILYATGKGERTK
ncbi:MAG: ExbD/TolR family protein [Flavobacteriales bacterium]|jgi:biopolymer transport protein ExbD